MSADPLSARIASLHLHPVKSCAGLRVPSARLTPTGLQHDREWMVVDTEGRFVTQRELPRMARIGTTLNNGDLVLTAPGMPALIAPREGDVTHVVVWRDEVRAWDLGDVAAQWLSDAIGRPLRLVRFDPAERRVADRRWTGEHEAGPLFADAFPILVASMEGLAELNRRLAQRGHPPVGIERFRPNVVIEGAPDGEDFIDELHFETPDGPVVLKLVKPCVRCTIPSVDPATGEQGHEPGDTLAGYRADSRMDGGITFGMNGIVVEGIGRSLHSGMVGEATLAF
jgi:uncharacterized protein YcbX